MGVTDPGGDLGGHVAGAIRDAAMGVDPFAFIEIQRIFPGATYAAMLAALPDARHYRPLWGRHNENRLPDGRCTRLKFELLGEYVMHLPPAQRALWAAVGAALRDRRIRDAFVERFAPALQRRFGASFRGVGLMPLPTLIRDFPGYTIPIHPDTPRKVLTVQFYLPADERSAHVGTVFHARKDGGFARARQMRFVPNSGYAFPVMPESFHSVDRLDDSVSERNSLMLTYYLDDGVLDRVRNRIKRVGSSIGYEARRLLRPARLAPQNF